MRIVGGQHRGRILESPQGQDTRPTSDRARESVFNILRHAGWLDGPVLDEATVLDVFAGTGALGLESLSQGAAHAVFMESDRKAAAVCKSNIAKLGEDARAKILMCDATSPPQRPADLAPRTLVFLDPPYGKGMGSKALESLDKKDWLADDVVCVLEMSRKQQEDVPAGFTVRDERRYGIALIKFMTRE